MKYLRIIILTLSVSSVANAELTSSPVMLDFGNVYLATSKNIVITNMSTETVYGFTVSMTGNAGNASEFSWTSCPETLGTGSSCLLTVTLTPQHYGKKKRKLNFDGYELVDGLQNDVTLTVPVIGSTDPH